MPRKNNSMVRTNIFLPTKLKEILKKLAKRRNVPYAVLVREALTGYAKAEVSRLQSEKNEESSD